MPSYELVLVMRQMNRDALKVALKRCTEYIFEAGATVRKMENLGLRNLPYKISSQGKTHNIGHFFVFNYDCSLQDPLVIQQKLKLDLDVVRCSNWQRYTDPIDRLSEKEKPECTMHLDLLPPICRPNVLALQELFERKRQKKKNRSYKNFEDTDFLIY